ncbi:MAG TPA: energy transducer TonB [Myxococcota bacterium]|nr:energy transducer TonB [Myxococcota bacterium]
MATWRATRRARRRRSPWARWLPFLLVAALMHVPLLAITRAAITSAHTPPDPSKAITQRARPVRLELLDVQPFEAPPEIPEPIEPEPEPEPPEPVGQIVDAPPPAEEQRPDKADYLSQYDITVPEEMRTEAVKINPEVVAPVYSDESRLEREDVADLNVDKPSTGARVGSGRFDPSMDGNMASLPSPWSKTNREGLADPVPSSHTATNLAGAPQNDLLNERIGDHVAVNTKEYLYAGYLERIRRLVNFYWEQNLDNLPHSVILAKSSYMTGVEVVLDSSGAVEVVEVSQPSGVGELDDCVVRAFQVAGPFPNPPEGLIERDGRVYLPDMHFVVQQGQARMQYQGVDPRAGVQFPGILKSPR